MLRSLAIVLVLASCGKGDKPAEQASAKPSQAKPAARPPSVTQEMADTFEAYVAAYEKLAADLGAAAPDCAKGVAAVERNARALDALDARGAALTEQMQREQGDAAGEWFAATFAARFKAASAAMGPLVDSCEDDAGMRAAMGALMPRFPMVRKKQ